MSVRVMPKDAANNESPKGVTGGKNRSDVRDRARAEGTN
jgi:hypothetical protein